MRTQRTLRLPQLALLVLLTSVWTACSIKPSEADGETAVRDQISREAGGRIQLNDFRKTNGLEGVQNGTPIYTLEYEADIEFLADCKWLNDTNGVHDGFKTALSDDQTQEKKGFWRGLASALLEQGSDQKRGDKATYRGKLVFEETERGWRPAAPVTE